MNLKKCCLVLKNKKVLDLGCGFGWHCRYAIENIDFSTDSFDVVITSLALHYIQSFEDILNKRMIRIIYRQRNSLFTYMVGKIKVWIRDIVKY